MFVGIIIETELYKYSIEGKEKEKEKEGIKVVIIKEWRKFNFRS